MPTCRVCKRDYVYDDEKGYDRELCGPMCDGIEVGRRQAMEFKKITVKLAAFCVRLHGMDGGDVPEDARDEAMRLAQEFKALERKQKMEIPANG